IPGTNNIGLSITTGENQAVVCVPRFSYECFTNTYINGLCYSFDRWLNPIERFPTKTPVCPIVILDLAFLIDGSGSVNQQDFKKMKVFVEALMNKFASKDTRIAVVQFSSVVRKEFDFADYNSAPSKTKLVDAIRQIGRATDTPRGMKYVAGDVSPLPPLTGRGGEQPLARFGASIASLRDLNGDGVTDVAVGAPLEDGRSGSVYIFHGSADGLRGPAAQHIRSADVEPGLQFFGRSIHGAMDVSRDGLTDIAVGALGKVVVFRSRPVVDVQVHTTFSPPKIKLKDVDCPKNSQRKPEVLVKMCLTLLELTKKLPESPTFKMFTKMVLDPGHKVQRAEVTEAPPVNFTLHTNKCLNFTIQLENCIQDTYNYIQLDMAYVAEGKRSGMYPAPILRQGSTGIWKSVLPFEQECGTDSICTDRLKVAISMSGTQFLVVGSHTPLGWTSSWRIVARIPTLPWSHSSSPGVFPSGGPPL
ncbi:integrin alpha-L-like, partial [Rhinoraja longicauda]